MSERNDMTLLDALRVVAEIHTRDDDELGFLIEGRAAPQPWHSHYARENYTQAWEIIRREAYRRPYWWRNLIWRIRNRFGGRP